MVTVKKISIGSAFKVGAVVTALQFAVFGLLTLCIQSAIFSMLSASFEELARDPRFNGQTNFNFGNMSVGFFILLYVCGIPVTAIFGGITTAIFAFFYNMAGRFVGGLEIEVEGL